MHKESASIMTRLAFLQHFDGSTQQYAQTTTGSLSMKWNQQNEVIRVLDIL